MVLPEHRGANYMATIPKRSNRLHNFSFPFLKWGNQRHMRCANAATATTAGASSSGDRCSSASKSDESSATRKRTRATANACGSERRVTGGGEEDGIAAVREKLMHDLKTAADRMKDAILRNRKEDEQEEEEEPARPWNLRTRRAECNVPPFVSDVNEKKRDCSVTAARPHGNKTKLSKLRSNSEKTTQRAKFSVTLSRKEVEEDLTAILGRQPPRRPKKRPKVVQKKLDTLFPGLWLTEVTADSYKVIEGTENQNG